MRKNNLCTKNIIIIIIVILIILIIFFSYTYINRINESFKCNYKSKIDLTRNQKIKLMLSKCNHKVKKHRQCITKDNCKNNLNCALNPKGGIAYVCQ